MLFSFAQGSNSLLLGKANVIPFEQTELYKRTLSMNRRHILLPMILLAGGLVVSSAQVSQAEEKSVEIKFADGKMTLHAPGSWEQKKPRVRIIEHEFSIPPVEGDKLAGRVTVMGAGGSVEQNLNRWMGQFSQPDGKSTKEVAVVEELKVAGQTVHLIDISGNFKDQRGPFAPATLRKEYRMMGAIIVTEKRGKYFLKMYGPKKTIAANEKKFKDAINTLKVN